MLLPSRSPVKGNGNARTIDSTDHPTTAFGKVSRPPLPAASPPADVRSWTLLRRSLSSEAVVQTGKIGRFCEAGSRIRATL